eukprot:CAMPEP_0114500780 /NCGR_PEP_ID=MMETSP0109-20121206/8146_1 /TAXON_ID=29199 /ORGANISM="Chlorarachnion reptans, Strain CCCM449" /LENGTH=586 /DNA_ID=CAMNT_0001678463 /DNA_START=9 /DNA_END=1769 /DNA_ORIENTATION=+
MPLSSSLSLDRVLEDLACRVHEGNEPVSYRWLCQEVKVPANLSKRILFEFHERNKDTTEAIYCVSGRPKSPSGSGLTIKLVAEGELEGLKETLDGFSAHVHSVRKRPAAGGMQVVDGGAEEEDLSRVFDAICTIDLQQQRELYKERREQLRQMDKKGNCLSRNWCSSIQNDSVTEQQVKISFQAEGTDTSKRPRKDPKPQKKRGGLNFAAKPKTSSPSAGKSQLKAGSKTPSTAASSSEKAMEVEKPKANSANPEAKKPETTNSKQVMKKKVKSSSSGSSRLAMMFKVQAKLPKKKKKPVEEMVREDTTETMDLDDLDEEGEKEALGAFDEAEAADIEAADELEEESPKPKKRRKKKTKKKPAAKKEASKMKKKKRRDIIESDEEEDSEEEDQGPSVEELEMYHEVNAIQERHKAILEEKRAREMEEENMSEEEEAPEANGFKNYFKSSNKKIIRKEKVENFVDDDGFFMHNETSEEEEVELEPSPKKEKAEKPVDTDVPVEDQEVEKEPKIKPEEKKKSKKEKNTGKKKEKKIRKDKRKNNANGAGNTKASKNKNKENIPDEPVSRTKKAPQKKMKTMFSFFQRK